MSFTKIALLIAKKEMRELSRDLRTVMLLVLVPALLYPLLLGGAAFFSARGTSAVQARQFVVEVAPQVPQNYQQAIAAIENAIVLSVDDKGRPDVRIFLGPDESTLVVESDGATELGQAASGKLQSVLRREARTERDLLLLDAGAPVDALLYRSVETIDVAPPAKHSGFLLSRILVPLLMTILMVGAFYPAADMTSGERERSTLQTLLCAPVPPAAIAAGKLITVTLVGLLAAIANILGLFLTASAGFSAMGGMAFEIPWSTLPLVLAILVPFALYVSAILMAFAAMTSSVKEAQTTLTPVFMVMVMPVMAASLPGSVVTWKAALIPIYGPALALREVFAGNATAVVVIAAILGAFATIVVAVGAAARAFTVDALMTGKVAAPPRVPGALPTFDAVLLVFGMAATYFVVGARVVRMDLLAGAALLLVVVFAVVPSTFVLLRSTTPLHALGLKLPRTGFVDVAGVLMIAPTLAAGGEWIARRLITHDSAMLEQLRQMAERLEGRPGWMLALVFVVVPAVCEEIAFRGALLRAFTKRRAWLGLVVTSLLFAFAHGALARMPITFGVGMLAGYAALRMRSVVGGMVIHFVHNGTALAIGSLIATSQPDDTSLMEGATVFLSMPWWVYALSPIGVAICVFSWRRRPGIAPGTAPDDVVKAPPS